MSAALISCKDVIVDFHGHRALDGVSLALYQGEVLGLLGESGSGKSTLARTLMSLQPPASGSVHFEGKRFFANVSMIFQDPASSLDARWRTGALVEEPLVLHARMSKEERRARVDEILALVGLPEGARDRYPAQLSGGQRQRVAIARALALGPQVVIADEPTSALDVSIKAQILNLLADLRSRLHLTMLFVSHDVEAVGFIADRIAVMRSGKIVEIGTAAQVTQSPQHPYTKSLIAATPRLFTKEK